MLTFVTLLCRAIGHNIGQTCAKLEQLTERQCIMTIVYKELLVNCTSIGNEWCYKTQHTQINIMQYAVS